MAIFLLTVAGTAEADMVILKSGEMFQTQKAWKEDGVVKYYVNGQVVNVDARNVERLISSRPPAESKAPPDQRPVAAPPSPAGGQIRVQPLPTTDDAGHLGLTWGLSPSQMEELAFVETDPAYGGVQQYTSKQANKRFGRASVDNVYYGFWQSSLYTILVEVSNYLDFMDLKAEAFRRFGETGSRGDDSEKYRWKDHGSDRLLAYDSDSDTGYLWMRSKTLHETVRACYPNE